MGISGMEKRVKVLIWGTGDICGRIYPHLQNTEVAGFVETFPKRKEFMGKKIIPPEQILEESFDFLLIAVVEAKEIEAAVLKLEISKEKVCFMDVSRIKKRYLFAGQLQTVKKIFTSEFAEQLLAMQLPYFRYDRNLFYELHKDRNDFDMLWQAVQREGFLRREPFFCRKEQVPIEVAYNKAEGKYEYQNGQIKISIPDNYPIQKAIQYIDSALSEQQRESSLNRLQYFGQEMILKETTWLSFGEHNILDIASLINRMKACIVVEPERFTGALLCENKEVFEKASIYEMKEFLEGAKIIEGPIILTVGKNISQECWKVIRALLANQSVQKVIAISYLYKDMAAEISKMLYAAGYEVSPSKETIYYPYHIDGIDSFRMRKGIVCGTRRKMRESK